MTRCLTLIGLTLILGCSTNKEFQNNGNTYLAKVINSIENGDCSNIAKGEGDKHFYRSQIDTSDLFSLLSKYNETFTSSSGKATIGTCRNNEVCEYCKDLIYSILLSGSSMEFKDLSDKEKIEKWSNDVNTFTDRSDIAYKLKDHLLRTNTIDDIIELYNLLNSTQKRFLLGGVKSDTNAREILIGIKENLKSSRYYYH